MKILDRLPIPQDPTSLRFGDRYGTIHANRECVWRVADLSVTSVASVAVLPKLLLSYGLRISFRTAHPVTIRRIRRIRRGAMRLARA
jgi:hypothetical protein